MDAGRCSGSSILASCAARQNIQTSMHPSSDSSWFRWKYWELLYCTCMGTWFGRWAQLWTCVGLSGGQGSCSGPEFWPRRNLHQLHQGFKDYKHQCLHACLHPWVRLAIGHVWGEVAPCFSKLLTGLCKWFGYSDSMLQLQAKKIVYNKRHNLHSFYGPYWHPWDSQDVSVGSVVCKCCL